jgi:hypothetical protein
MLLQHTPRTSKVDSPATERLLHFKGMLEDSSCCQLPELAKL